VDGLLQLPTPARDLASAAADAAGEVSAAQDEIAAVEIVLSVVIEPWNGHVRAAGAILVGSGAAPPLRDNTGHLAGLRAVHQVMTEDTARVTDALRMKSRGGVEHDAA